MISNCYWRIIAIKWNSTNRNMIFAITHHTIQQVSAPFCQERLTVKKMAFTNLNVPEFILQLQTH